MTHVFTLRGYFKKDPLNIIRHEGKMKIKNIELENELKIVDIPNDFKNKIREQYIDFYPPIGNIIHASDSPEDCEKELDLLLNENIGNFKNIGTYYSQLDI